MHQASIGRSKKFDSRYSYQSSTDMDRSERLSLSSQAPLCAEDRKITWRDIQSILPTALILLLTLVVILTVIPYAFSNVLRQMEAVRVLEEAELSRLENLNTEHLTSIKNSVEDL